MDQKNCDFLNKSIERLYEKFDLKNAIQKKYGSFAISFIFNDKVIKFTISEDDAINSYNISKYKDDDIINVISVNKYKLEDETDWIYIIVMERAFPLNHNEKKCIINFLSSKINLNDRTINGEFFKPIELIDDSELNNTFILSWQFSNLPYNFLIQVSKKFNCESAVYDLVECYKKLTEMGFAHDDVHRYNIMKNKRGKVCLIDYGIGYSYYKDENIPELNIQ